jgi:hypothetical protein
MSETRSSIKVRRDCGSGRVHKMTVLEKTSQQRRKEKAITNCKDRNVPGSRSTEGAMRIEHSTSTSTRAAAQMTNRLNIVSTR